MIKFDICPNWKHLQISEAAHNFIKQSLLVMKGPAWLSGKEFDS